jgi:transposase
MRSGRNIVGEKVKPQSGGEEGSIGAAEGARSATGAVPIEARVQGPLQPGQRWSLARRRDVVLRLLRGEPVAKLSRELGVEIYRLEQWRELAVAGLESGLREREADDPLQHELDAAKRHIGELSMEIELLRERARAAEGRLPLGMRRSRP